MKATHVIAFILVIVGALNWGLIGINSNWNLVMQLLGTGGVARTVYILVGLSAIVLIATHKKDCKCCDKKASPSQSTM